ncbi:MAG: carbamoyl transferase, partial [Candidatus Methylomirabilis sp.]|nr:carbamoyl transferase [Deltaproteobacteria bacterium]
MHDAAAALLKDGEIVAFVEEERFSRRKHTTEFPHHAIRYCLDAAGIAKDEVDHIAFFWVPWKGLLRRGLVSLAGFPSSYAPNTNRYRILRDVLGVRAYVKDALGFPGRFHFVDHHQAHMASTFFLSPFEEAAVWIADGSGEEATTTYAVGGGTRLRKLREVLYPHSLGHLYLCVTEYLGFREQSGEGKVMGLAPYGDPAEFRDAFKDIIWPTERGGFEMDMSWFDVHLDKKHYVTQKFIDRFGPRRARESKMEPRFENVAAALQEKTEEIALHALRWLREESGRRNLCLAGGV